MSGDRWETRTIVATTRLRSSLNGNPRYRVEFEDGQQARTRVDSACAYDLQNKGNIGVPVRVRLTPAGELADVVPVGPLRLGREHLDEQEHDA